MDELILEAKRRLYLLLINKAKVVRGGLTDNEAAIFFRLSEDEQIQSLFETKKE
jgi:hypothetical protein